MSSWFASHFLHPHLAMMGLGLLAVPVLIHLLNRLRYRRVRFAAMEFLLASEQRNRRRILLEQLLLLLLRMGVVALLVLLIARWLVDPRQLTLLQGAKVHHVVLLDDSLSMRERQGETTRYAQALQLIRDLLVQAAQQPDLHKLSLLRLSRPEQPVVTQREMNEGLLAELSQRLDPDYLACTHRALRLSEGIRAAQNYLAEEKGAVQTLHVITDLRAADWSDRMAVSATLEALKTAGVTVNVINTASVSGRNLALTEFSGATHVAVSGVPLRLRIAVTNYGEQTARDVRVSLTDDQVRLPRSVVFETIEPRTTVSQEIDVTLMNAAIHRLAASLEPDVLEEDNVRYLAVTVAPSLPVLVVDGSVDQRHAEYLQMALASDPQSTGISVTVDQPDALRRRSLESYACIYLCDVPDLALDAMSALHGYVNQGGGVAWYVGAEVRPNFYRQVLYGEQQLFPLPLADLAQRLEQEVTSREPDIVPGDHPLFSVLAGQDNPFLQSVYVETFFPPMSDWALDDTLRDDGVQTLARLRNQYPLVVESRLGAGRIVACLTSLAPDWNDWARNPSFVVFQLELVKHLARRDRAAVVKLVGESISQQLDPSRYTDLVEIVSPDITGERITRLQAVPEQQSTEESREMSPGSKSEGALKLSFTFRDTDHPGIYELRLVNHAQQVEAKAITYNIDNTESDLRLMNPQEFRQQWGHLLTLMEPGRVTWSFGQETGAEIRHLLLILLVTALLMEQWLAYRWSYHPPRGGEAPIRPRASRGVLAIGNPSPVMTQVESSSMS